MKIKENHPSPMPRPRRHKPARLSLKDSQPPSSTPTRPYYTLPETNIAPENRPVEKEIPIENHHFWGLC